MSLIGNRGGGGRRSGVGGRRSGVGGQDVGLRVAVIDYGAGNLTSVCKGLRTIGAEPTVATTAGQLEGCRAIVVPGVGNFGATTGIDPSMREAVLRRVGAGVPILGICLGMQWLFDGSDEAPEVHGLGLFLGRCRRLSVPPPLKVPHVGWNELTFVHTGGLLAGIGEGAHVYFTHAFAAPVGSGCAAVSTHGERFAAAVQREHICGVQFHPEKSGPAGLQILRNFVRMAGN